MIRVAGLAIYPVKGLRGIILEHAILERQGLEHDRRWALRGPNGTVLTQRDLPAMARIAAIPQDGFLHLECDGAGHLDAAPAGPATTVDIWGATVPAIAADAASSRWLQELLGAPCTLVHLTDPNARPVTPDLARPGDVVSLADGFPVLVTTTASVAALNAHLATPVPMDRFRPNLVLEGADPWTEDSWSHLDLPGVRLRVASACSRCTVTTIDQRTGAKNPRNEPFRTLGHLHRDPAGRIAFGVNAVPERLGLITVGDAVTPILHS